MSVAGFTERLTVLRSAMQTLPDKPEETPEATLRALWCLAAGRPMSAEAASHLADDALPVLDAAQDAQLGALTAQRLAGIPLAHLTGRQTFMGMEMLAGPQALIPRRETELLARAALVHLRAMAQPRVIDVCTGSGNLALSMAQGVPTARVWGADLSPEAVALAEANARHLGLSERVQWRCGDLLAPFDASEANAANAPHGDSADFLGRTDLLLCNPPYISSGKLDSMPAEIVQHEPSLAFDGGPFGIRILQRLMKDAPRFLRSGGWLGLEVGLGQGPAVQQWLARTGQFGTPQAVPDDHGQVRSLLAQRL
ncbi:class I SAM-dependent methyltransferase [Aquabacterium sp.]|uniref:N5-glutamine methyltransferase family protein n=1 Tax=Aquabacterium sp. TaxID=1872578 RepID=UPI00248896D0|nr:HemK family protein methyltransferase [Aquabacterium sp.]MDI1348157.1 HemK family protein methyltransferase [Aquabacterium sp.]